MTKKKREPTCVFIICSVFRFPYFYSTNVIRRSRNWEMPDRTLKTLSLIQIYREEWKV